MTVIRQPENTLAEIAEYVEAEWREGDKAFQVAIMARAALASLRESSEAFVCPNCHEDSFPDEVGTVVCGECSAVIETYDGAVVSPPESSGSPVDTCDDCARLNVSPCPHAASGSPTVPQPLAVDSTEYEQSQESHEADGPGDATLPGVRKARSTVQHAAASDEAPEGVTASGSPTLREAAERVIDCARTYRARVGTVYARPLDVALRQYDAALASAGVGGGEPTGGTSDG